MELRRALRLGSHPAAALVGAGGKSSALFKLAEEYGPPIILTASTHLALWQIRLFDSGGFSTDMMDYHQPDRDILNDKISWSHHIVKSGSDFGALKETIFEGIHILTGPVDGDRTIGITEGVLEEVGGFCLERKIPLIIEADGSRSLPLKAPAEYEPVIPEYVDTVVVVAGMSAIGKKLTPEWVHRPKYFARISGLKTGETITLKAVRRVLTHPSGGLKGIPPQSRRVALLNQVDSEEMAESLKDMTNALLDHYDSVVISGYRNRPKPQETHDRSRVQDRMTLNTVHAAIETISGIVLAGGEGKRYGQPKQLLDWKGKPFVWHCAKRALDSGLEPVVVVTGAYKEGVEHAVSDLPVRIVDNPTWQLGQGTSVGAGVKALPTSTGAAVFLLGDQPHIPQALLRILIDTHGKTLARIIAPFVGSRQANPVLFDRDLFLALSELGGDVGGRELFSKEDVYKIQWDSAEILWDVDTPGDYERLLLWEG